MGSRNLSKTAEKSSSSPCAAGVFLHPSVCLCLFVCLLSMKTRRIFTQELKSGCPRGIFCLLSIPSKYLFLCTRRTLGFNKKIHTKLLIVYMYFQPNSCNTYADREWAQGTFLTQRRKVPPAHAQRVYFSVCSSVCPLYENTQNFHIGIKIRVSTWSFLSVVHPLQIPIPMCEKKILVQQENLYKITYCLHVFPT